LFSHGLRKPRRQGPVIAPLFVANSVRNRRHLTAARATPPPVLLKGKCRRRQTAAVNALGLAVPRRKRLRPAIMPPPALRAYSRRRHVPGSGIAGATQVLRRRRKSGNNNLAPVPGLFRIYPVARRVPGSGLSSLPKIYRRRRPRIDPTAVLTRPHSKRRRVPLLALVPFPLAPKRKKAVPHGQPPPVAAKAKRRKNLARPSEGPGPYPLHHRKSTNTAHATPPPIMAAHSRHRPKAPQLTPYVSPIIPGPFEVVASQISFAGSVMGDIVAQAIVQGTLVKSRRCHTGRQPAPAALVQLRRRHGQRGSMVPNR
jgi:hypothetical protein